MEGRKFEEEPQAPISEQLKVHESCIGSGDRETMSSFRSSSEKLNLKLSDIKDADEVPVKEGKATTPDRASPVFIPLSTDSVTIVQEKPSRSSGSSRSPKKSRSLSRPRADSGEAPGAASKPPSAPTSGSTSRSESASGLFQYQPAPVLLPGAARPPVPAYVTQPLQLAPGRERDVELEGCFSYEQHPPALSPDSEAAAAAAMDRPGLDLSAFLAPLRLAEVTRDVPALGHASDDEPLCEEELEELEKAAASSSLVQRLRLRNAKLEGKMEVLSRESDITLRERAELASKISALRSQVKQASSSRAEHAGAMEKVREELRQSHRTKEELDGRLVRSQAILEQKESEAKSLCEELETLKNTNSELVFRVKELEGSGGAKECTIGSLKAKVAELYLEVENARLASAQLDKEAAELRTELSTAQRNRAWYEQQLASTREARDRLREEAARIQALIASGSSNNDSLVSENSSLRLELSQMEQELITQKRLLAEQLEAIRSDMIEREALFEQVAQEHSALEQAFAHKMQQLAEERTRTEGLQKKMEALNSELAQAQAQLESRDAQLKEIEEEKAAVVSSQQLLQELVSQKDRQLEEQCSRYNELADQLRKGQEAARGREAALEALSQERSALEVQLASSRKEKEALDRHIVTLKGDMVRVEESFRSLRSELGAKASELGQARALRDDVSKELEATRAEVAAKEAAVSALQTAQAEAARSLSALRGENEGLCAELCGLRGQLEAAELRLVELEAEVAREREGRAELEEALRCEQTQLQEAKGCVRELRVEVEALRTEHAKYMQLLQAHAALKAQMEALVEEHRALTVRFSTETSELRARIDQEVVERERVARTGAEQVRELQTNLQDLQQAKEGLQGRLAALVEQHDQQVASQAHQHHTQMELVGLELSGIAEAKRRVEEEAEEARSALQALTAQYNEQLMGAREEMSVLGERAQLCDTYELRNKDLGLELERTRGKIDGLLEKMNQLKQHTNVLEDALAKREGSLVELASQSQACLRRSEEERAGALDRLTDLQRRQQLDEELRGELSEQLAFHRSAAQKMRLEAAQLRDDKEELAGRLQEALKKADSLGQQVESLSKARSEDAALCEKLKAECAEVGRQLAAVKTREMEEEAAAEERRRELESLNQTVAHREEQIATLERRLEEAAAAHAEEMDKMRDIVEGSGRELGVAKGELEAVRKEKLELQSRLAHLRGALRAAIQRYRLLEGGTELDLSQLEQLLEDPTPLKPSKPLLGLSRCLEGLRSDIDGLQSRMGAHVRAVRSPANHWRQLESQTEALRRTCDETKEMLPQVVGSEA